MNVADQVSSDNYYYMTFKTFNLIVGLTVQTLMKKLVFGIWSDFF